LLDSNELYEISGSAVEVYEISGSAAEVYEAPVQEAAVELPAVSNDDLVERPTLNQQAE